MKEQSDTLVGLIHDAAAQVGPVDGIDGEAMARRAIRHERTRRGVIGGAAALLLVAVATAGTALALQRPVLPAFLPWVQDDGPAEVRSDGLVFELPDDYEEFSPTGDPMWGLDPVIPDDDMEVIEHAPSWVAVDPAQGAPLVGELVGNPVTDVDVPGASAARWSWYSAGDVELPGYWERGDGDGDFVGELDVELTSGAVVRLTMSLTGDDAPQETFERLVESVRVDGAPTGPDEPPSAVQEDLPLLETTEPPAGWARSELHGLTYAAPGDWAPVGAQGDEHPSDTVLLRRPDGTAELEIAVADRLENTESLADIASFPNFYRFELADADASTVLVERFDGEYRAYAEVRRAGGRSYTVNLSGYAGAGNLDGELTAILGGLGFGPGATEGAPGYEALDPAEPLLQDPPADWEPATFEGIRLALPPGLRSDEGSWGVWSSDSPDTWEDLSFELWDAEAYDQPVALEERGYRYEPRGTTRGTVTVGTDDQTGEPTFLGRATFHLTADGRKAFTVRYEGAGATEERWWQILASLDAAGLTSS